MIIRILAIVSAVIASLIPEVALAGLVRPLCSQIPGACAMGPKNVIVKGITAALPVAATFLLNLTAGLSLIFVIIGGARYLMSFGRDEEFSKAKNTIQWALIGLIVSVSSHRMVTVVTTQTYLGGAPDPIVSVMKTVVGVMTGLLNAIFFIVVIGSGMRMVMARGKDDEVTKGKYGVMFAIAGAVVINVAPYVVKAILAL